MILVIDNYDSFTFNLVQRLGELDAGLDVRVMRNDAVTAEEAAAMRPTHLIVSPGPCTPREAGNSPAILAALAGSVPTLGVCLGHQCIGAVHGMTVARAARPMHGKTSPVSHDGSGLFAGLPDPFEATRYHSLVVLEETVPREPDAECNGWTVSAWTADEAGGPRIVMGLRRIWGREGPAPLDGVQFHPESFLTAEGPRLLANFIDMGRAWWRTRPDHARAIG